MHDAATPDLSVILSAEGDGRNLTPVLSRLRHQTIAARIEVLIAAPDPELVRITAADRAAFADVRIVSLGGRRSLSLARALCTQAARADFVAFGEDHCFPSPEWAEVLLTRLGEGYAGAGPQMVNANPGSVISWASFLVAYGGWTAPIEPGAVDTVPGHNSAYRREVLLGLGEELPRLLQAETVMHWELAKQGARFFVDPAAQGVHFNMSRLGAFVLARLHAPRVFSSVWSRHWPWRRRLYFAALAPLISVRRLGSLRQRMARMPNLEVGGVRLLLLIFLSLLISGLMYSVGFLFGAKGCEGFEWQEEIDRARLMRPSDRPLLKAGNEAAPQAVENESTVAHLRC
jgi:hypothetical protein